MSARAAALQKARASRRGSREGFDSVWIQPEVLPSKLRSGNSPRMLTVPLPAPRSSTSVSSTPPSAVASTSRRIDAEDDSQQQKIAALERELAAAKARLRRSEAKQSLRRVQQFGLVHRHVIRLVKKGDSVSSRARRKCIRRVR